MCTFPETIYAIRVALWYFALYWFLILAVTFAFNVTAAHFRGQWGKSEKPVGRFDLLPLDKP